MTDKELLELAAKAVGYDHFIHTTDSGAMVGFKGVRGLRKWNPLADDGDALRLAVKLKMDIGTKGRKEFEGVYAMIPDESKFKYIAEAFEPFFADPYAATRRAIVLAAAEIGKGMK